MDDSNYYMIITSPLDYIEDVKNQFRVIGFPERNRNSVKNVLKIGDKVVFYLTKISSFSAIVEITGEYFYDKTKVWYDEYDVWPHRIPCKPIAYLTDRNHMVYIKDIWDNLDLIKNKGKWGSQVQGSFRKITQNDFNLIFNEIRKRSKL